MALTKIHFLPFFTFILIPSTFIITYCISVYLGHVDLDFPYISDTGTQYPESCIFSQLINIVAALLAVTMYVRYKLIEQHYRDHLASESTTVLRINLVAIIIGWIGCFGVSLLANFQESRVIIVHMIGAMGAFGCATLYCWLHTLISHYVCPLLNSRRMMWLRLMFSIVITISFGTTLILGVIAHNEYNGTNPAKWKPEDGGFVEHIISTASEWILVLAFDFFLLTYTSEMKKIAIGSPQVHFVIEDHELRSDGFYSSEDRANSHSQASLTVHSPTTPYGGYTSQDSMMTTQAIIH